jgi:hypothetical protein
MGATSRTVRNVIVGAFLVGGLVGCSSSSDALIPSREGLAAGQGRLAGRLARPPGGTVPTLTLTFTNGAHTATTVVKKGVYRLDLPAGVWDVRSTDGKVCTTGLHVGADAWQRGDLVYPTNGCQNLATPPPMATPPPLSGAPPLTPPNP